MKGVLMYIINDLAYKSILTFRLEPGTFVYGVAIRCSLTCVWTFIFPSSRFVYNYPFFLTVAYGYKVPRVTVVW